jgi:hypothetical protein
VIVTLAHQPSYRRFRAHDDHLSVAYGRVQIVQFGVLRSRHRTLRDGVPFIPLGLHKGAVCKTVGFSKDIRKTPDMALLPNLAVYEKSSRGRGRPAPSHATGHAGPHPAFRQTAGLRRCQVWLRVFRPRRFQLAAAARPAVAPAPRTRRCHISTRACPRPEDRLPSAPAGLPAIPFYPRNQEAGNDPP